MRGFVICFALALALGICAWWFMDSWVGIACLGGALWLVLLAVRHGLSLMGGDSFHKDEATQRAFINWFRAHVANQRAKRNPD